MRLVYGSFTPLALVWMLGNTSMAMAQSAPDAASRQGAANSQQESPAGQVTDQNSIGLQDIIVTAQRRTESLQRAAIAVDVVSAETLSKALVTSSSQLGQVVPSLQTANAGGTTSTFYLRGVGTFTSNPYTDSAVAFNLDGIYIGKPNATTGYFYDLARLEVLKGPQGTLYGRNATGGAINVIPQAPEIGSNSGFFTATLGNYDTVNLQGAVNLAVSANSALRISGAYAKHDGYLSDGSNDLDGRAVRAQYLVEATPDLKIRVSGDYFERSGRGSSGTITQLVPINIFNNTLAVVPTGLKPNVGPYDPRTDQIYPTLFNGQAGRTLVPFSIRNSLDGKFWGVHAQIDWTTPIGTLTVIPAYRHGKTDDVFNTGNFVIADAERQRTTSLEARLAGDAGPLSYILGAFYYDEDIDAVFIPFNQVLNAYQVMKTETKSYAGFGRLTYHITDRLRAVGGFRYTKDRKTIDGVSNVALDICTTGFCPGAPLLPYSRTLDGLISTMGLIPVAPNTYIQPGNPAAANTVFVVAPTIRNDRLSDSRPTYRAALEFDVTPASLLYASFENGFRSGGFAFSTGHPSFGPEKINAWTIGSKNRFFDNRLQLNVEAFYWKYNNQQVTHQGSETNGQPGFFTENIGRSTNKGFEVEAQILATENTLVSLDMQYLDAKYKSFVYTTPATPNPVLSSPGAPVYLPAVTSCAQSVSPTGTITVDCSGQRALASPKWTLTLGIQQTVPIGNNKLVFEGSTKYQSSSMVGFEFLPSERQSGYWRSNAGISFVTEGDRFSAGLFVNNIENNRQLQVGGYTAPLESISGTFSDPRTYGVRMSMRF